MAIGTATIERPSSAKPSPNVQRLGRGVPDAAWQPYEPKGANRELMRDRSPELLIEGPADTGKSMACLNKLLLANLNYPGNRTAMVRKTRRSLTQSTMVSFEHKVLPAGAAYFHEGDQEYRFPNGSVCVAAGLDDPGKVFSTEFDFIYVNEADQLDQRDYESLRARCTGRWGVMPYTQLLLDMNPTYPTHFLYEREKVGQLRVLTARHEDNPTITPQRIAALDSLSGWLHKRLRLGLRVAPEGMYFTEWEPERHIVDGFPIPEHWTRWTATDYGYADPFCCLWFAREPQTRRIYVYRELYASGFIDEQQAPLILRRSEGERFQQPRQPRPSGAVISLAVGDPSMFNKRNEQGKPSIASVYQQKGVPLVAATNSRVSGWQVVRRAMTWKEPGADGTVVEKPPRLQVFRDACPNLIRTIPMMVADPLNPEDLADAINGAKTEDHPADTLRYGLVAEATAPKTDARQVAFAGG